MLSRMHTEFCGETQMRPRTPHPAPFS